MGFAGFVILASMRTGSNLLEARLNALPGVTCHGEAFNPVFIGRPNATELMGLTLAERDANPDLLLDRFAAAPGLNGFRFFPDHDPRVLPRLIADPVCAKIVLTRNPFDSYVSLEIARSTGQWRLAEVGRRREARVTFVAEDFARHAEAVRAFHADIRQRLQQAGQAAFNLDYDELRDDAVLDGLRRFLGAAPPAAGPTRLPLPQNPDALADKVVNPQDLAAALRAPVARDPWEGPDFERPRGPAVGEHVVSDGLGLMFQPIAGGPTAEVTAWLAAAGPVTRPQDRATLRQWMVQHPGHRRFTVLRHPLLRAFAAFEALTDSAAAESDRSRQVVRLAGLGPALAAGDRPEAFAAFLGFLRANLSGQTPVPTQPSWSTQIASLRGLSGFMPPDSVLRENSLAPALAALCPAAPPLPSRSGDGLEARLSEVAGPRHAALARRAYGRDYVAFGFADWSDDQAA